MEKISWLNKVINEEFLRRVRQASTERFGKGNLFGLAMFGDTTG